jgi:hypothetical protein
LDAVRLLLDWAFTAAELQGITKDTIAAVRILSSQRLQMRISHCCSAVQAIKASKQRVKKKVKRSIALIHFVMKEKDEEASESESDEDDAPAAGPAGGTRAGSKRKGEDQPQPPPKKTAGRGSGQRGGRGT